MSYNAYSMLHRVNQGTQLTLVNTKDTHSKYWKISCKSHRQYTIHNGRIGTKGVVQATKHMDMHEASKRVQEKLDSGYREVSDAEFKRLSARAAIIGSKNKVEDLKWVNVFVTPDNEYCSIAQIPEDQISDPGYDPAMHAKITVGNSQHCILIKHSGVLVIEPRFPHGNYKISRESSSALNKVLSKIIEVVSGEMM